MRRTEGVAIFRKAESLRWVKEDQREMGKVVLEQRLWTKVEVDAARRYVKVVFVLRKNKLGGTAGFLVLWGENPAFFWRKERIGLSNPEIYERTV